MKSLLILCLIALCGSPRMAACVCPAAPVPWASEVSPYFMCVGPSGNVYVTNGDVAHTVTVHAPGGAVLATWSVPAGAGGAFMPEGVAVDAAGIVHVSDIQNSRIVVLDSGGRYVRSLSNPGTGAGQFLFPFDLVLGPDNDLFVVEAFPGTMAQEWGPAVPRTYRPGPGRLSRRATREVRHATQKRVRQTAEHQPDDPMRAARREAMVTKDHAVALGHDLSSVVHGDWGSIFGTNSEVAAAANDFDLELPALVVHAASAGSTMFEASGSDDPLQAAVQGWLESRGVDAAADQMGLTRKASESAAKFKARVARDPHARPADQGGERDADGAAAVLHQ